MQLGSQPKEKEKEEEKKINIPFHWKKEKNIINWIWGTQVESMREHFGIYLISSKERKRKKRRKEIKLNILFHWERKRKKHYKLNMRNTSGKYAWAFWQQALVLWLVVSRRAFRLVPISTTMLVRSLVGVATSSTCRITSLERGLILFYFFGFFALIVLAMATSPTKWYGTVSLLKDH